SLSTGCGEEAKEAPPTPYEFGLTVEAMDSEENPVVKAPVVLDDKIIGYTDRDGKYQATLTDLVGTQFTLGIGEMSGYHVPESATIMGVLERVETIDGFSNTPVRLRAVLESARQ